MFKIHLKSHNGQYVCAEGGGGREVVANRAAVGVWETFTIYDQNGGLLQSGDIVYLAAHNGQYVCAEDGGGREVVANRSNPSIWEKFTIEKPDGTGEIKSGDKISLRCFNGQYVCAENGGGREVVANRAKVSIWETFVIEIENNSSSLPIRVKEYTHIGTAKHMETNATLSQNGIISAQTTTWTTWKAKGFTGGVIAVVGDENGNILYRSNVHSFGVDGEWIGRSRRTDMWEETVNITNINSAKQLKIIHFHNPTNRLVGFLKSLPEYVKTIGELIKVISDLCSE